MNIKDIVSNYKWNEHKFIYGFENKKNTYFVIRRRSKEVGLFSYVLTHLGWIDYAIQNGYIPVIDMLHYNSPYLDKQNPYNVWEYYFEQPYSLGLNDIKRKRHVILSSGDLPERYPGFNIMRDTNELEYWRILFHKFIRINEETLRFLDKEQNKYFDSNEHILGVLCRGTDYTKTRPKGHPKQPELDDVIRKVQEIMFIQGCNRVYLATEDKTIYDSFLKIFGDKLIFPQIEFRPYDATCLITEIQTERKNDNRLKGLEYLLQIYLLSKCNCFIGSGCGGAYGALLMADGFDWQYFWDLGNY